MDDSTKKLFVRLRSAEIQLGDAGDKHLAEACVDAIAEIERLQAIVDAMRRIHHFATGSCDLSPDLRLKCIARECEASLATTDSQIPPRGS